MNKKIVNQHTLQFSLLFIILLVSIVNRFYGLDRLSLWADELWVVMESSKGSLFDMFSFVQYHDNHPPGHYLFTRYWQMIFGGSDFMIRFPFAVAGVFLVYSTYLIGKEHYSTEAGLIAAALISSAWQAIYYSQEARANILVAVAALWSLHYFCRLVFTGAINKNNLIGFWSTASICCYLHYAGTVFIACLAATFFSVFLLRREKSFFVLGLKIFLPVFLLYAPWIPSMFYHLTHKPAGAWWEIPPWAFLYGNFKWIFGFGSWILMLYQAAFLLLLFYFCITVGGYHKNRNAIQFGCISLLMVVMPAMIFFIKSRISQPVYDYRHFVFTLPLMAMAAGHLVSLPILKSGKIFSPVLLVITVIFLIINQNYYNIRGKLYLGPHFKAEYRQTVEAFVHDQKMRAASPILIVANSPFFNYYLQRLWGGRTIDVLVMDSQQASGLSEHIKTQHPQVIYFLEAPETRDRKLISAIDIELAKTYRPICRSRFVYAQLIKFSTESPQVTDWEQVPVCRQ